MSSATLTTENIILRRKILGVKVRQVRTRTGLSSKEIGQVLGISADMMSKIELGERDISLPQLEVIALVCNVPLRYFWSDDIGQKPNLDFPAIEAMAIRRRIISALLHQIRMEGGRTLEDLAQVVGISADTITNYESGQVGIPIQILETLSEYFDVSIDYFIDQGIAPNQNRAVRAPTLDDVADYAQLSPEIKEFLSNPGNILYLKIAMKLSNLSVEMLRNLAEGLLEVTY